jgi:hypothetical protein
MRHLEQLIHEYYNWQGYLVRNNVKVGKLKHGGYEMELDIIAFKPQTKHLIHLEPSIDSHSWEKREMRFKKKFDAAKKYIHSHIFDWLDKKIKIEHYAILINHPKGREYIGGGKVKSIDELTKEICDAITLEGKMEGNAISENYPLLRTIQLTINGYYKKL